MQQAYVKIPIHCQWWYKWSAEERGVKLSTEKNWHTSTHNVTIRNVPYVWQRYKHGERMESAQQQLIGSKSIISTENYTHKHVLFYYCRSRWPHGLRRGSAAPRLLGLWVRIPLGVWKTVCCECCVLSGRGLCDRPIIRTECAVSECNLKISRVRRPWPNGDCRAMVEYIYIYIYIYYYWFM